MKAIKAILWVLLIIGLIFIGSALYFITQFTAVYPPIEKYAYKGSYTELLGDLDIVSRKNLNISFNVTDTTGGGNNPYIYYVTIIATDRTKKYNEYMISYQIDDNWFGGKERKIFLIGAFDRMKQIGGYKEKNNNGVAELKQQFENEIYIPLNNR